MVEVKNIEVYGLDRALNAKGNSFNVGDIDTTVAFEKDDGNKQWKVAKILGANKDPHQSHDAFLKVQSGLYAGAATLSLSGNRDEPVNHAFA